MSSVEMIQLILVCLLGGLWETEALPVTGVLGEAITINCSHVNAFSNVKYFCKGECGGEDILISSRRKKIDSNDKYMIRDEGNTFYVTISHLTEDDSGAYWCGVDRLGLDTHNKVELTVVEGAIKEPDNNFPQSISNEDINIKGSSSKRLVYIGAGLGVVVLALSMVILIFFRYRSRHISARSGNVHNTVYATPLCLKQDAPHIATSSLTSNEDHETGERSDSLSSAQHRDTSRDHPGNIYSNVTASSESQRKPGTLFYSTVRYSNTAFTTVTPPKAEVSYATINYTSTGESTIYCNV